jgi:predicted transcriptional regulator of viral defense system
VCDESIDIQRKSTEVADLAARQHGLVTRVQLRKLGLSGGLIDHRLRSGGLHRVHTGVYALAYRSQTPHARMMAAVLACGPGAALSHRSAAELWGFGPARRGAVEVTVPGQRRPNGIIAHRSLTLAAHVATLHRIPVTTAARTLIDLAAVLDDARLGRAINDAHIKRLVALEELAELAARSRGRATARVSDLLGANAPTRSVLEDRFLAFLDKHALPRPEVNQRAAGHEVDALWPEQRLIVELDGRAFHDGPAAFERDRERDAQLMAAGYRVLRITWRRLSTRGDQEARRLRALLEADRRARPARRAPPSATAPALS